MKIKQFALIAFISSVLAVSTFAEAKTVTNGKLWTDTKGNAIQAHDTVLKAGGKYYWYGLDYSHEKDVGDGNGFRAVKCYESDDLVNWTLKNNVLTNTTSDLLYKVDAWNPQVVYCKKTGMYVMWLGTSKGMIVAASDKPYGNFHIHNTTFNVDQWTYMHSIFIDDDGAAYVVAEALADLTGSYDQPKLGVLRLTDDYLELRKEWSSWGDFYSQSFDSRAIGRTAIVKHNGVYYLLLADYGVLNGSGNAFTKTRPTYYDFVGGSYTYQGLKWAWANSLYDEWSGLNSFANTSTAYEFSNLITVQGSEGTSYIVAFNGWNAADLSQSTYTWQPLQWSHKELPNMDTPYVGEYAAVEIDAEKGTVKGK